MPTPKLARIAGIGAVNSALEEILEQWDGQAVYVVGTSKVYGVWLENGTSKMQAYPWLEPALDDVIETRADDLADNADSADEFIASVALAIEAQAIDNVSAERASGRSPGTHSDHPKRISGDLAGDIRAIKVR